MAAGCRAAGSAAEAVSDAEVVISMLPAGPHVRAVYGDELLTKAPKQALLIDCSTIDVESARAVAADAKARGFRFADAPVSGGTAAAEGGTLAFMVGCDENDFAAAPSNRDYEGGFATAMMLKDLKLAQEAAARSGAAAPLGAQAEGMYALFDRLGGGSKDFSAILELFRGQWPPNK